MKNKKLSVSGVLSRVFPKNYLIVFCLVAAYIILEALVVTDGIGRQMRALIIPVSYYIVLAISLNLVVGLLGELSLGHAGFAAAGLYSGVLFSIALESAMPDLSYVIRLPLSMIAGGLFAAVIGFVVGLPALRLKGDYLAIVTLACGEIIRNAITNLSITGGARGIANKTVIMRDKDLLPIAAVLVIVTALVSINIKNSRQGRAIMAIRDNRIAAEATGINVTYYKLVVFMIAAFFAGMAGVLYGHFIKNVQPSNFDYNKSIEILVIVVLGGMGSINGSVIAAIILQLLPELLREFADLRMLVYSVVLILLMILNESPQFADLRGRMNVKNIVLRTKSLVARRKQENKAEKKEGM